MKSWKEENYTIRENDEKRYKDIINNCLSLISTNSQKILQLDDAFLNKYLGKNNIDFIRKIYSKIESMDDKYFY